MAKREETLQMAELYKQGLTHKQIGNKFQITPSAVGVRLRKLGFLRSTIKSQALLIDEEKLTTFYETERLTIDEIATVFGVTIDVVNYALKSHGIPKRSPIRRNTKYLDRLRNLKIGETVEIECSAKHAKAVLKSSVGRYGIILAIQKIKSNFYRVTRIDANSRAKDFNIVPVEKTIKKKILEELYGDAALSVREIASQLNCSINDLYTALKMHRIPKRLGNWGFGKYTSVFKKMNVGDVTELKCPAKYPHTNLHNIASRIGMKISIRKIANQNYQITKLR